MKSTIFKRFILLCIIPLSFWACSKENDTVNENQNPVTPPLSLSGNDSTLVELSKVLAKSISNEDVLKTITNKVLDQIDGDYNTLFVDVVNSGIEQERLKSSSGKTLSDILIENADEGNINPTLRSASSRGSYQKNLEMIQANNPLLQVAMPLLEDDFNGDMSKLNNAVVAYLPENLDDGISQNFIGYNSSGKEVVLNTKVIPNFPVVIISQNERLIPVSRSSSRTSTERSSGARVVYSTSSTDYYLRDDLIVSGRASSSSSSGRSSSGSTSRSSTDRSSGSSGSSSSGRSASGSSNAATVDRDLNNFRDHLYKARFTSQSAMRKFESWGRGRPEVYYSAVYYSKAGAQVIKNYLGDKYWYDGNTREFNIPIINWDLAENGKQMKYLWIESDGGKSAAIETSFTSTFGSNSTTTKVSIPSEDKDQVICDCIVNYDDVALGEGTKYYGNNFFEFWINIHE